MSKPTPKASGSKSATPQKRKKELEPNKNDATPAKHPKLIKDLSLERVGGMIQGRVESESPIRSWSREGAEGIIFSFIVNDSSSDINVVASGEICAELHEKISVGKCYVISAFKLKKINPQYNITSHQLEIQLTKISKVTEIIGINLPENTTNFITLAEIGSSAVNSMVDILGIIHEVADEQNFMCRDGTSRKKKNVRIVDDTKKIVTLSLWSEHADILNGMESQCVSIHNVVIRVFNMKKVLTTTSSTSAKLAVITADSERLQKWWNEEGQDEEFDEIQAASNDSPPNDVEHRSRD
ncbi:replication factor A protein 1-like [Galendromus occidentalis]|uniref:Replication factor A protein 1-like n=1 Tax=Galendromus occidentalis TaxID=34638 RepID=A0AAJ6QNB8_9ACAR|nr:replication factor A protein 1-like [Galendromus occidentalis]